MIETRKSEIRFKTSDPERMLGKYTVNRVMKTFTEESKKINVGEFIPKQFSEAYQDN